MVKAIFFDIDGTLRDFSRGKISAETKEALRKAGNQGILLFVATGRHVLEIEEGCLLEDLVFDGYVTLNGAYCYDKDGVILACPMEQGQVERLMKMAAEEPFPCLVMEEAAMYINMVDELVEAVQESIVTPLPEVRAFERVGKSPVYQMVPYLEEERIGRLMELLPGCGFTRWHTGQAYDITPAGVKKEKGIAAVLKAYGIDRKECAAIGDGYNDISMIQYAGIGIAMGNGNDEIKEAADYVTASVEENGVAQAVDWLLAEKMG